MKYYLLFYTVVEEFAARRTPYRAEHLALAEEAFARGDILLAGAYGEPPCGAALLFRVADRESVEAFAAADPYVTSGLVLDWRVEPWHVVVGDM